MSMNVSIFISEFVKRSCRAPAPEGNSLGDYGYHNGDPKSLEECKALCAAQSECKSFVFSEIGQKCHLKDKEVTEGDDCQDAGSWNFETYYLVTTGISFSESRHKWLQKVCLTRLQQIKM